MRRLTLLACLAIGSSLPVAAETLPGPIPADVVRVVDGDTIQVRAHIWVGQTLDIMVRIADIDAPEIHRPACSAERRIADRAKAEVEAVIGESVHLHQIHLGKYAGRIVADAYLPDGRNLSAHLLAEGLAVPMGETDPWCPAERPAPNARP